MDTMFIIIIIMSPRYKDKKRGHHVKNSNNRQLVDLVTKHVIPKTSTNGIHAIVLDGPTMQTCRSLHRCCDSITVVERDVVTAHRMSQHVLSGVHVVDGVTLANWLGSINDTNESLLGNVNVVYFDYMGTVTGNRAKGEYPLEDISCFLENWACSDGRHVVMCLTFCARMSEKLPEDCPNVQSAILDLYLDPIIRWHGFRVVHKTSRVYRRTSRSTNMVFVSLVLQKRRLYIRSQKALQRDRLNIDFAVSKCGKFYDGYNQTIAL